MKTFELKASLRKSTGKKDAKALRKKNLVPCVIYGGKENIHFYTEEREFKDLLDVLNSIGIELNEDIKRIFQLLDEQYIQPSKSKNEYLSKLKRLKQDIEELLEE